MEQLLPHLGGIRLYHVVEPHVHRSACLDALRNGLGQHAGVAVRADIRNDDRRSGVWIPGGGPLLIGLEHPVDLLVQNRAVSRTDHVYCKGLDPLKRLAHKGFIGPDDAVKVVFRGPAVAFPVGDRAEQHAVHGIVRAEGIAGDKNPVLGDIGIHGVRPVEVGYHDEFQRLVIHRQRLPVLDGNRVKITVYDFPEKLQRTARPHDLQAGIELQQPLDASAVIRLRVADDQIVHRFDGGDLPHLLEPALQTLGLCGLEEDSVVLGLQDIGIIGRSVLRVHNDVKYPEVMVDRACKIQSRL